MALPRVAISLRGIVVLACLLWALSATTSSAQTLQRNVLLTITRLNFDCYPDTVFGVMEVPKMRTLPTKIRWGQPLAARDTSRDQSGGRGQAADSCSDGIDRTRKVEETAIIYPDWRGFNGSVAFQQMNYDSVIDMVFYMRGTVEINGEEHDTLRPLVVYGQYGLDTMMMLNLSAVPSFQSGPFFAAELFFGDDLINEERRDMSDSNSWELLRRDVDVKRRDTSRQDGHGIAVGRGSDNQPMFAVHPNPSQDVAAVEAEKLPVGKWTVEVIGVNGAVYDRQEVVLTEPGNVLRTVNVRGLANGYYVLRVRNTKGIVGTYPIVVKR